MKGDAAHLDRHIRRLAARRQRNVEQPRSLLRILEKQLVEIAHPVKQQIVRMSGFQAKVLAHHRRVLCQVEGHCALRIVFFHANRFFV